MSEPCWHVRSPRGRWGPLRDGDVREGVRLGRFGPGALAWRRGLPSWQPLVMHFPPLPRRSDTWKLVAGLAGVGVLGAASVGLHLTGLERFGSLRLGLAVWGATLLVLLPLAFWVAWRGWRRARRLQPFRPLAAGAQRMASLVVLMLAAGVALVQAVTMPVLYPTLLLREGFRDYRIEVVDDGDGRQLQVAGLIGPGFSQSLSQALAASPGVHTVVLSSPGGLVDEALLGAGVLHGAGVTAIARRECDSACVILLLGAQRRLADWDLALGLHAVSDLRRDVADAGQPAVENMAERAWNFMRAQGIPQAVLDEAEGYQANELLPVPAIDLVEAGALHGLTDGGRREVPVEEGKWRFLEGLYAWRDPDDPVAALMALVRDSRPGLMQRWAEPIHSAWAAQAMGQAGEFIGRFAGDVFTDALRSADDHAVTAYYRSTLDTLQQLGSDGRWQDCQALAEGWPWPERGGSEAGQVRGQLAAVLALAESAAEQQWQVRPLPEGAERDGQALLAGTLHQVAGRHANDPRRRCEGHVAVYRALMAVSPHEAAPVLRWLGGAEN